MAPLVSAAADRLDSIRMAYIAVQELAFGMIRGTRCCVVIPHQKGCQTFRVGHKNEAAGAAAATVLAFE